MSEGHGLDERLRSALGADGNVGTDERIGAQAAKARVVAGVRQRRLRRLQFVGAACVVLIGLAATLPQVLGGAAPKPRPGSTHRTASTPAAGLPAYSTSAGAASPSAHGSAASPAATCRVMGRTVTACGDLAAGSNASQLATEANSSAKAATTSGVAFQPIGSLPALAVRAGTRVVIELPDNSGRWKWSTPKIAGRPVYHGPRLPVTVQKATGPRGSQYFFVSTHVGVTLVLEAQAQPASGAAAPSDAGPAAVWALVLKVEEK